VVVVLLFERTGAVVVLLFEIAVVLVVFGFIELLPNNSSSSPAPAPHGSSVNSCFD